MIFCLLKLKFTGQKQAIFYFYDALIVRITCNDGFDTVNVAPKICRDTLFPPVAKFFTQFDGNSILPVHLQAGFCKDQICTGSPIINLRQ